MQIDEIFPGIYLVIEAHIDVIIYFYDTNKLEDFPIVKKKAFHSRELISIKCQTK